MERRLRECPIKYTYIVECLDRLPKTARQRLQSLGVGVGSKIYLMQRFPVYVIRCDYTQIALDNHLAKLILVTKETANRKRR